MSRSPDPLLEYLKRPTRRRLASVVRACHDFVWATALRATGDEEEAADVEQDVFLKLLLKPPPATVVRSPRGYLAWCVLSRVSHLRRSAERRRAREIAALERNERRGHGASQEDLDALRSALATLPDELRGAVELHYLAGLPSAEIAETLGVAERTVRDRMQRARDLLARKLGPLGIASILTGAAAALPADCGAAPPGLLPSILETVKLGRALSPPATAADASAAAQHLVSGAALAGAAALLLLAGLWVFLAAVLRSSPDAGADGVRAPVSAEEPAARAILRVVFTGRDAEPISPRGFPIAVRSGERWSVGPDEMSLDLVLLPAGPHRVEFRGGCLGDVELEYTLDGRDETVSCRFRPSEGGSSRGPPGDGAAWRLSTVPVGARFEIPLTPRSVRIEGRAVSAADHAPVGEGTLLVRGERRGAAESRRGAQDRPGSQAKGAADMPGAGDPIGAPVTRARIGDLGEFGFEASPCERTLELTIESDAFPPPDWVRVDLPRPTAAPPNEPIDLGRIAFTIPENGVWGEIAGEAPEGLRLTLKRIGTTARTSQEIGWGHSIRPEIGEPTGRYEWRSIPPGSYWIVCTWTHPTGDARACVEPFSLGRNQIVRRDLSFHRGGPLRGRLMLPWSRDRDEREDDCPGARCWPPFQENPFSTSFVPGPLLAIQGHNFVVQPSVILRARSGTGITFVHRVEWDPGGEFAGFEISEGPAGRCILEVVFFDQRCAGRDVVFSSEIDLPAERPIEIDLRHLRPVRVRMEDPVIEATLPFHADCWNGMSGTVLAACEGIIYTIESIGARGDVRLVGVQFGGGNNMPETVAEWNEGTGPWKEEQLGFDFGLDLEGEQGAEGSGAATGSGYGPGSGAGDDPARARDPPAALEPRTLWALLFVPPGERTFRVSRALGLRVGKPEYSAPEACAEISATVGEGALPAGPDIWLGGHGEAVEEVRVRLDRPRVLRFEDGQYVRLDGEPRGTVGTPRDDSSHRSEGPSPDGGEPIRGEDEDGNARWITFSAERVLIEDADGRCLEGGWHPYRGYEERPLETSAEPEAEPPAAGPDE